MAPQAAPKKQQWTTEFEWTLKEQSDFEPEARAREEFTAGIDEREDLR